MLLVSPLTLYLAHLAAKLEMTKTRTHSQGLLYPGHGAVRAAPSYSQWLYILLHSKQVSSSFEVLCGRTLRKAFSKSVKAGGLEGAGSP